MLTSFIQMWFCKFSWYVDVVFSRPSNALATKSTPSPCTATKNASQKHQAPAKQSVRDESIPGS
ncbi:hypothetical protein Sinac_4171 [Singulisphaera acidiphila DSM 18658]|uniref:Uncharacterized protein n=1 Tax=Singulisphaera acidiphila (strain ATCC BAA-1392 / DSM 18658 / VKM B-2454 / MOB10) TaxID=886293 RepID=L0DHV2_SINAD|nr:hypothetical protein Sinac_4171 [Singulisphaera acidiphila DSM 18658]